MTGAICPVCPRGCRLAGGQVGACRARGNVDGEVVSLNYGMLTSLALDPIEKKPLAAFMPGSRILSVGSYGCNLFCPFCQNHEISRNGVTEIAGERISCSAGVAEVLLPDALLSLALEQKERNGNIGVAFTYNEPLIGWEYVRDCAKLLKKADLKVVLVTNGCVTDAVLDEVLPLTDALNIDLKAFSEEGYERLGGNLETVKNAIRRSAACCHVEVTSLIVPGLNDSAEEMEEEAAWLAGIDPGMVLHLTRYFPRYRMAAGAPTEITLLQDLRETAGRYLRTVLLGNV